MTGRGLQSSDVDRAGGPTLHGPVRFYFVVIVDCRSATTPIPGLVGGVFRRAFELRITDVDLISFESRVVFQQRPRQRIIVFAHAQETAEAHDGIADLSALLSDHHTLDLADLVAV